MVVVPSLFSAVGFLKPDDQFAVFHMAVAERTVGALIVAPGPQLREQVDREDVVEVHIAAAGLHLDVGHRDHVAWDGHLVLGQADGAGGAITVAAVQLLVHLGAVLFAGQTKTSRLPEANRSSFVSQRT